MEQMEHNLVEQAVRINMRKEYIAYEQCCDDIIKSLDERSRIKRLLLSRDNY